MTMYRNTGDARTDQRLVGRSQFGCDYDQGVAATNTMATLNELGEASPKAVRIDVLDGWRAVSVALVIVSHILLQSSVRISDQFNVLARKIYIPWLEGLGYVGVDIFFVISGFVICRGFIKEFEAFNRISVSAFHVRRMFRILPPLIMYLGTIYILSLLHVVDIDAQALVRALTFTCNIPVGSCGGWLAGHTWSLSVEEQFYLIIPIVFSAFSTHRGSALTTIVLLLPILVLSVDYFGPTDVAVFLSYFYGIGIGVACALHKRRLRAFVEASPQWLFYVAITGILMLARLYNTRFWPAAVVALALVIAYSLLMSMSKSLWAKKWLTTSPMRSIGRASYGLYLWQQLATSRFPEAGIIFYISSMCCCLLLVFASYNWIERPLIKIGAAISHRLQGVRTHMATRATREPFMGNQMQSTNDQLR